MNKEKKYLTIKLDKVDKLLLTKTKKYEKTKAQEAKLKVQQGAIYAEIKGLRAERDAIKKNVSRSSLERNYSRVLAERDRLKKGNRMLGWKLRSAEEKLLLVPKLDQIVASAENATKKAAEEVDAFRHMYLKEKRRAEKIDKEFTEAMEGSKVIPIGKDQSLLTSSPDGKIEVKVHKLKQSARYKLELSEVKGSSSKVDEII